MYDENTCISGMTGWRTSNPRENNPFRAVLQMSNAAANRGVH